MDGVVVWDKEAGVTSHDVVARVRRAHERGVKVGHAGTLDPFATGLLLILLGRATRVQRFLMALPKTYEVVARFGAVSSTGDRDGEIRETGTVPERELALPTGTVRQRPPAYSAVKVAGERAYERARRGEEVELAEREVVVHAFAERWHDGDRRAFSVACSSGTYVRSLIADLGDAYCEELRRTQIGPFAVDDADPARVLPLAEALAFLPERRLDPEEARRAAHGVAVPRAPGGPVRATDPAEPVAAANADGPVRLTDASGLVAIAEPRDGVLKPVVGFRG